MAINRNYRGLAYRIGNAALTLDVSDSSDFLTNCKNCGAALNGDCEYCGTKYASKRAIVYDPRYIRAEDVEKDLVPVQYPKPSFWKSLINGGAMAAVMMCGRRF